MDLKQELRLLKEEYEKLLVSHENLITSHKKLVDAIGAKSSTKVQYQATIESLLKCCTKDIALCTICKERYDHHENIITCDKAWCNSKDFYICSWCQEKWGMRQNEDPEKTKETPISVQEFCSKYGATLIGWGGDNVIKFWPRMNCNHHS